MANEVKIWVLDRQETMEKLVHAFMHVNSLSIDKARALFEIELNAFKTRLQADPKLAKVSDLSIQTTFIDIIASGLSFQPIADHIYLKTRNKKKEKGDNNGTNKTETETLLVFELSPNGKIYLAQKVGSIKGVTEPEIVFEGEDFYLELIDGVKKVHHQIKYPRPTKIVLGYCHVINPDNSYELITLDVSEVKRLEKYSEKQNRKWDYNKNEWGEGKANELYTSGIDSQIDIGFFTAKIINKALKRRSKKIIYSTQIITDDDDFSEMDNVEPVMEKPLITEGTLTAHQTIDNENQMSF